MEIEKSCWLEDFDETCQDIMEDAIFLEALATYMATDNFFMSCGADTYFPLTLKRSTSYLSQHALDLCNLERRLNVER